MVFLLILFFVIVIGCIIRYASGGTGSSGPETSTDGEPAPQAKKTMAERSVGELEELLRQAESDVEIQKIEYQGSLANPYCWPVTRNLIKSNLDSAIAYKHLVEDELNKRTKSPETAVP